MLASGIAGIWRRNGCDNRDSEGVQFGETDKSHAYGTLAGNVEHFHFRDSQTVPLRKSLFLSMLRYAWNTWNTWNTCYTYMHEFFVVAKPR
jgi:hypothetical protein